MICKKQCIGNSGNIDNLLDDIELVEDLSASADEFYDNQNIPDTDSCVDINSDNGNLYDVKVYIEWTDRGETRDFTLETRIHSD